MWGISTRKIKATRNVERAAVVVKRIGIVQNIFYRSIAVAILLLSFNAQALTVTRHQVTKHGILTYQVQIPPARPTVITVTHVLPYGMVVNWDVSQGSDSYILEHKFASQSQWQTIYTGAATSHTMPSPQAINTHEFRVKSCSAGLCSPPSTVQAYTMQMQADSDNDGVYDYEDTCPSTTEGQTVNSNGCATYQLDTDNDGINDAVDQCPTTPAGALVNIYGCAPTTVDSDNDGVTDDWDQCEGTVAGSTVNSEGCDRDQIDSDADGTPDYLDAYPHQSLGYCPVPTS